MRCLMKFKLLAVVAAAVLTMWNTCTDAQTKELAENGGPAFWYTSEMRCQKCGRVERYEGDSLTCAMSFEDYQILYPDWRIEGHETNCICLCPDCQ